MKGIDQRLKLKTNTSLNTTTTYYTQEINNLKLEIISLKNNKSKL